MSTSRGVIVNLPPQSRYIRVARLVGAGWPTSSASASTASTTCAWPIGEACGLAVHSGATR